MTDIHFHVLDFVAALAAKRDAENTHVLGEDLASTTSALAEADSAFGKATAALIAAPGWPPGTRQDLVTVLRVLFEDDEALQAAANRAHQERRAKSKRPARPSTPSIDVGGRGASSST